MNQQQMKMLTERRERALKLAGRNAEKICGDDPSFIKQHRKQVRKLNRAISLWNRRVCRLQERAMLPIKAQVQIARERALFGTVPDALAALKKLEAMARKVGR